MFPDGIVAISIRLVTFFFFFFMCKYAEHDPKTFKSLWQLCPCLQWALDQTPQDRQRQSKRNYFLLSYTLHSSSHKQNSSPPILTEDLETACSISKPDDIRCWILPFDTFPARMCWFPSPKHFWITFMQNWGPSEGQAAPFSLH